MNEKLNDRQKRALRALVAQPTKRLAAKEAGISESTLGNYLREPKFRRAYDEAMGEMISDAVHMTKHILSPTLKALFDIVCSRKEKSYDKISAAKILIESTLKLIEHSEVVTKINELELAFAELK